MKKFIKIIARYISDDLVTYKEYVGKPYYEIMYEENGEVIVGFGSFKIDFISKWINEYFIDNKIDKVLEIIDTAQTYKMFEGQEDTYIDKRVMREAVEAMKGGEQDE